MLDKKYLIWAIGLAFILTAMPGVIADPTNLTGCGTTQMSMPGQYVLNQSISGTGTCLTISSSNVELDCQGNTISYGTAGSADSLPCY